MSKHGEGSGGAQGRGESLRKAQRNVRNGMLFPQRWKVWYMKGMMDRAGSGAEGGP